MRPACPQSSSSVLFFVAGVYFLLLRPQQQRVRRQRELITAIGVGDRVVTAGGLIGRVVDLTDDRMQLEIADGVVVEVLRLADQPATRRVGGADSGFAGSGEFDGDYGDGDGDGDELEYESESESESGEGEGEAEDVAGAGDSVGDPDLDHRRDATHVVVHDRRGSDTCPGAGSPLTYA